jgi:hypothetical protein
VSAALAIVRAMRSVHAAIALIAALPVPACAQVPASLAAPESASPKSTSPNGTASPGASGGAVEGVTVTVGGGFWSPRLAAVARAIARCSAGARAAPASLAERELFDALACVSLDGDSLRMELPATCSASCTRPAWTGDDQRGCASLGTLAALDRAVWRVDGGEAPTVTAAILADSELSFTAGGIEWRVEQNTDYPWSGHVGFVVSHQGPTDTGQAGEPARGPDPGAATDSPPAQGGTGSSDSAGADAAARERALGVRVQLPEWLDPASVRVSARGRMLAAGEYTIDGRTLAVHGPWSGGDRMLVSFPMAPRRVTGAGGTEIWRGPLRYVAEAADQVGGALADATVAPGDGLREVPYVLGAVSAADAPARQGDPVTQRPTPEPDAAANSAPNGIMAVMVERRTRGLPDLVLVPLAFAGNRGDMPRIGTFAAPAP